MDGGADGTDRERERSGLVVNEEREKKKRRFAGTYEGRGSSI